MMLASLFINYLLINTNRFLFRVFVSASLFFYKVPLESSLYEFVFLGQLLLHHVESLATVSLRCCCRVVSCQLTSNAYFPG